MMLTLVSRVIYGLPNGGQNKTKQQYIYTIVTILLTTTVYLGERFPHPSNGLPFCGLSTWNLEERK